MNTGVNQGPATIYQFPKRATEPSKRIEAVAVGGSWYHEEAIRESVRGYGTRDAVRPSAVIVPLNFPRQ